MQSSLIHFDASVSLSINLLLVFLMVWFYCINEITNKKQIVKKIMFTNFRCYFIKDIHEEFIAENMKPICVIYYISVDVFAMLLFFMTAEGVKCAVNSHWLFPLQETLGRKFGSDANFFKISKSVSTDLIKFWNIDFNR